MELDGERHILRVVDSFAGAVVCVNEAYSSGGQGFCFYGISVILTGDLNVADKSEAYKSLTDEGGFLVDTSKVCKKKEGVNYSFHSFGRMKLTDRSKIDYIFVSSGIKVKECVIPHEDPIGGVYISDHNPIIAYILIK